MKSVKGIIAVVALFVMSNACAQYASYSQFVAGYRGPVITANNMVEMSWVQGAIQALINDRMVGNLMDNNVFNNTANMLWKSLEPSLNYYAGLPQNRNNPAFRQRVWESLTRSLDEVRRSSQQWQMAQPSQQGIQGQFIGQQRQDVQKLAADMFTNFRTQTSQIIRTNPTYFYSVGYVQQSWLREALRAITANGQWPLTMHNKNTIQAEMEGAVGDLVRYILQSDPRNLSARQKDAIIQSARYQVGQFINAQ